MTHIKGLSAVVVTYNRRDVVETCLMAARFCEELIVIDKGSTDGTAEIGQQFADIFRSVTWTPTVEGSRADAVALASGEWILLLDDDECLNSAALEFIHDFIKNPLASICYIPIRHYVMGKHDPHAYYWPEYRGSLFRRGALEFSDCVHAGVKSTTDDVYYIPSDSGPAIEHLSHESAAVWLEKTNRYTSQSNRAGTAVAGDVNPTRILELMQSYLNKVPHDDNGYLAGAAALRGLYDVVDAIKHWESSQSIDGAEAFRLACTKIKSGLASLNLPKG